MRIKYTEKFKKFLRSPEYILQGFYFQFGSELSLDNDDLIEKYKEDQRKSRTYTGNTIEKDVDGEVSTYISIELDSLEKEKNYLVTYLTFIDLMNDHPGDLYPEFDPDNFDPNYWNADGTPGKVFIESKTDPDSFITYRVQLAGVLDNFSELATYGHNIIDLGILPECDIKLQKDKHMTHITSDNVDKWNYHEAGLVNKFLELDSSIDKLKEFTNNRHKHIDSIIITKSGKIVI